VSCEGVHWCWRAASKTLGRNSQMTSQLIFTPWVPRHFDGTLILGESTFRGNDSSTLTGWSRYFDKGFPHEFIRNHVRDNILNDDRTFRRLRESFAPVLSAQGFWARKAFTNFVPELLKSSRDRPSQAQWHKGQRQFELVLDLVQPERILVVGTKLWENLPPTQNETSFSCIYRDKILAMWIPHPSWWNRARPRPYSTAEAQRITAQLMRHGAERRRALTPRSTRTRA